MKIQTLTWDFHIKWNKSSWHNSKRYYNRADRSRYTFIFAKFTLPEIIKKIRLLFRFCFNVACIYFGSKSSIFSN